VSWNSEQGNLNVFDQQPDCKRSIQTYLNVFLNIVLWYQTNWNIWYSVLYSIWLVSSSQSITKQHLQSWFETDSFRIERSQCDCSSSGQCHNNLELTMDALSSIIAARLSVRIAITICQWCMYVRLKNIGVFSHWLRAFGYWLKHSCSCYLVCFEGIRIPYDSLFPQTIIDSLSSLFCWLT